MKKNKKKEEFKLILTIDKKSSELIQRLEKIIIEDTTAQKLPNDFTNPAKSKKN